MSNVEAANDSTPHSSIKSPSTPSTSTEDKSEEKSDDNSHDNSDDNSDDDSDDDSNDDSDDDLNEQSNQEPYPPPSNRTTHHRRHDIPTLTHAELDEEIMRTYKLIKFSCHRNNCCHSGVEFKSGHGLYDKLKNVERSINENEIFFEDGDTRHYLLKVIDSIR